MKKHNNKNKKEKVLGVEKLSKKFCKDLKKSLWYGLYDLTSEILFHSTDKTKLRKKEFWALEGISFSLYRGETLGLIGHNGAGKSTLLKLINGIFKPDSGSISIKGKVSALIELGAGFNPILTGRENIYVNAAVLGIPKSEVDKIIQDIIDFAEIGDFIDAPVQSYSSGMRVRLGFSIAANLNPDILLIDEVLAVGDSSFRQRCYNRLNEYKKKGGTIIFVSHNMSAVEAICDRVILLDHGRLEKDGDTKDVISVFNRKMDKMSDEAEKRLLKRDVETNSDSLVIESVKCYDFDGNERKEINYQEPFEIRIAYNAVLPIKKTAFHIAVRKGSRTNQFIALMVMSYDGLDIRDLDGKGTLSCIVKNPELTPGNYYLHISAEGSAASGKLGNKWYAKPQDIGEFTIIPKGFTEEFPGVPTAQISSSLPPIIPKHIWINNDKPLEKD